MADAIPTLELDLVEGGHMLPVTQPDRCAAFIRTMAAKAAQAGAGPGGDGAGA